MNLFVFILPPLQIGKEQRENAKKSQISYRVFSLQTLFQAISQDPVPTDSSFSIKTLAGHGD